MGKKRRRIRRGGENPGSQWRKRSRNPRAHERMTSSANLVGLIVGTRLLAPGRKKEEEEEGEKGSDINTKKQMGNINKMNYVIFDNKKKILSRKNGNLKEESRNLKEESRKNGNLKEERRSFVAKKKDIENKKLNNHVTNEYKKMMMKRKNYDMCNEKEKETGVSKEFNKIRLKKLTLKYLGLISFKHKVRKQYRGSCKGNVVACPPLRDNG